MRMRTWSPVMIVLCGLPCLVSAQLKDMNDNTGYLWDTSLNYLPDVSTKFDANSKDQLPGNISIETAPSKADSYPLFRSMDTGNSSRVVAHTKYGDVTSKDLYLWLTVANSQIPADIVHQYDQLKTDRERKVISPLLEKAVEDYIWHNKIVPSMSLGPLNEYEQELMTLRQRIYELPAYQLIYMLKVIKPMIKVTETDRIHALRQNQTVLTSGESWQVRYIFLKNRQTDANTTETDSRAKLEDIRSELVSGKISFSDAARKYSEAQSASAGGEIPTFFKGQYFFGFEDAVTNLEPGQLSEVFPGPGGMYLAQLIQKNSSREPSLNDPETAAKVDEIVMTSAMRAEFKEQLRRLNEDAPIGNMWTHWDTREVDEPIGYVVGAEITKGQLEQILPVEDPRDLDRRDTMMRDFLTTLLERENMAKVVRAKCLDQNDSDFKRLQKMAGNLARRYALQDKIVCKLNASESAVRTYYNSHPELFTPMPMKRLVRLTLAPVNIAPTTTATLQELSRVIEGRPRVPDVVPVLPVWDADISRQLNASESSTSVSESEQEPEVTTSTVSSEPQTSAIVVSESEKQTTAGGETKTIVPGLSADQVTSSATASKSDGGADTCPPAVDNRKKIPPTRVKEMVAQYVSSDWLLQYDDYGYVYLEDLPALPKSVRNLQVDEWTTPVLAGSAAVSFYLEDERRWPLQPFDAVRAYANEVYRQAKVDDVMFARRKSGLEDAQIEFCY